MSKEFEILKNLPKNNDFFIGFDSDGCVFDTMEIKHKECFCPNFIKHMGLQTVSKYARETWDFVNLYSKTRGANRFNALVRAIELLGEREEVKARNAEMPDLTPVIDWIKKETKLGNPALEAYAKTTDNKMIHQALGWSRAVNASVTDMVFGMPPFPYVRESLQKIQGKADAIVVSQTPLEALEREWKENDIEKYVSIIAGQEFGTKTEHLKYAAVGKYDPNKILMIGDAPGDLKAAKNNDVLYYPINPGHEEASWERFYKEGLDKFFDGSYAGDYEKFLIEEFESFLPECPPWK